MKRVMAPTPKNIIRKRAYFSIAFPQLAIAENSFFFNEANSLQNSQYFNNTSYLIFDNLGFESSLVFFEIEVLFV